MDCLELMKTMDDNSVDCIATDPPYGYSFMGKNWDRAVPSVEIWCEALRVLKDGAFAFIMSAPRQDVLMHNYSNLQQAGFDTAFTSIYWCYASGFPKASNIGKVIDKRNGEKRKGIIRTDGQRSRPTTLEFADRPIKQVYEDGNPVTDEVKAMDGSYAGFQPKPALEVIIVAMKPLSEKTYVEQAIKDGKGVTWLDDCRIPFTSNTDLEDRKRGKVVDGQDLNSDTEYNKNFGLKTYNSDEYINSKGRFPANLLVSDNALDIESNGAIAPVKSGQKGFGGEIYGKFKTSGDDGATFYSNQEESNSFSRYFDVDRWFEERVKELPESARKTYPFLIVPKPSKAEKNLGCEEIIPTDSERTNQNWRCTCCNKLQFSYEGNRCKCESPQWERPKNQNNHPTVKPINLMAYLITLGSRKGDLIYDPFVGSGTTAIASELMERMWIASELDTKSCEIAKARLSAVLEYAELPTLTEVKKMRTRLTQKNLFDYT